MLRVLVYSNLTVKSRDKCTLVSLIWVKMSRVQNKLINLVGSNLGFFFSSSSWLVYFNCSRACKPVHEFFLFFLIFYYIINHLIFLFRVKNTLPRTFMSFCTSPPELKKVARWYLNSIKVGSLPHFRPFSLKLYACHSPKYQWNDRKGAKYWLLLNSGITIQLFLVQRVNCKTT